MRWRWRLLSSGWPLLYQCHNNPTHYNDQLINNDCLRNHLQDADDEVALEAAEFWLAFCESDLGMELLVPVMARLIPVLMKNMVSNAAL